MAKAEHEHWKQLKREAREQAYVGKAHAHAEQERFTEAAFQRFHAAVCDVIVGSESVVVVDNLFTLIRHYVREERKLGPQLEGDVRAIWEARR